MLDHKSHTRKEGEYAEVCLQGRKNVKGPKRGTLKMIIEKTYLKTYFRKQPSKIRRVREW